MSRNFTILLAITLLSAIWFISSCTYVWQFPVLKPVFMSIGHGAVTIVKYNTQFDTPWAFLGIDSGKWDWTWDFQNRSVMDFWRVRLPLWPIVFSLIGLSIRSWYRIAFRRPYLCSKCSFDLRGTVSNPARICNECGTPWNPDFLAAQTGTAGAWDLPGYPANRTKAKSRFFALIAMIFFSFACTMLLVSSYAAPQAFVQGETTLSFSRFVLWITRSVNDTRLVDSGIDRPNTARQIITTFQTMPNGSFIVTIPLWPFIAGFSALLWFSFKRFMAAHAAMWHLAKSEEPQV